MKTIFILALTSLCLGCGKLDRAVTSWTGELTYKCSNVGTKIVQSDSGIVMLLDRNNKTVPCNY